MGRAIEGAVGRRTEEAGIRPAARVVAEEARGHVAAEEAVATAAVVAKAAEAATAAEEVLAEARVAEAAVGEAVVVAAGAEENSLFVMHG